MATVLFRPTFDFDRPVWVPALRQGLTGHDVRIAPEETGDPADIDYLVLWRLTAGDRTGWPNLKAVLSLSAGVNQFMGHPEMPDVPLIRMIEPGLEHGMAEYVASMVLRFHRDHDRLRQEQDDKRWTPYIPPLATARTVGFMGMGHMAQACIDVLKPFGFALRGWSRSPRHYDDVECFSGEGSLSRFLAGTDILVCLLPHTPETENILNRQTLAQLPRGACLINAARGRLLVDADLLAALDDGHIARAALDVFHKEPLPSDHSFWIHRNIVITPHIAAISIPDTGALSLKKAIDQLEQGEKPEGLVDLTKGY